MFGIGTRLLAVAMAAVGGVGACGSTAEDRTVAAPPSAFVERDGVAVLLTVERQTTGAGLPLSAAIVVSNLGRDPILWRGNGCALSAPLSITGTAPDPVPAAGAGPIEALRSALLAAAGEPAPFVTLAAEALEDGAACRLDHGFSELPPGVTLRYAASWPATTVLGAPAASGDYLVDAQFPTLRPGAVLVPAGFDAARDVDPIRVQVHVSVVAAGAGANYRSAEGALDLLLADARFTDWLIAQPDTWPSARMAYLEGRWEVRVTLPGGRVLIGSLDDGAYASPAVRIE